MPGYDTTGPRGAGPMTRGGRGFCAHAGDSQQPFAGGRPSFRWGGGRGWRNQYHATGLPRWQRWTLWNTPVTAEDEKQALKSEADFHRSRLQILEERLAELNAACK